MGPRGLTQILAFFTLAGVTFAALVLPAHSAEGLPQVGCYKRFYDAKHLRARKGQFARKITLDIEPLRPEQVKSGPGDLAVNADLRMWVKGHKRAFAAYGTCKEKNGRYDCSGHDLANEHIGCKTSTPGVHDCRAPTRVKAFRVEARPQGVVVTVPESLELDAGETGPYLNLLSSDAENSAFLLPARPCR